MFKGNSVIKKKRISTWLIVAVIMLLGAVLIWVDNPVVQPGSLVNKLMASLIVVAFCQLILLLDELFVRLWNWLVALNFFEKFKALTDKKSELSENTKYKINIRTR